MNDQVRIRLSAFGGSIAAPLRYFHLSRAARDALGLDDSFFSLRGDVVFADLGRAHLFAGTLREKRGVWVRPAELNAMGLVHEVFHAVLALYKSRVAPGVFGKLLGELEGSFGADAERTLTTFVELFPPPSVYRGELTAKQWLGRSTDGCSNREWALEELLLLWLSNQNPAYAPITELIADSELRTRTAYAKVLELVSGQLERGPKFGPGSRTLLDLLMAPVRHAPSSITAQLEYMRNEWGLLLEGTDAWRRLLLGMDFVAEEGRWFDRKQHGFAKDDALAPPDFHGTLYEHEPERFSADIDWMPRVVMIAKSTYVWLHQLSRQYGRDIRTLADIPDQELELLARRGFTALWLIGLWRRSRASERIKRINGNPEAVASAYSLDDYVIAEDLGGDEAYRSLKERAARRGLRLASDMVPNHMGIDSRWVREHPDWFIQTRHPPFPNYTFDGPDLSDDSRVGIFLEDGYYRRSDAAVVFKRVDRWTGDVRFLYHGNDGTSMPWNDTAQLDYLKAEVREAVIQTILHVARQFPIIRFDAAMTLAKRHYQRLWYPMPGSGGDIPSRAQFGLTRESFEATFPVEFWREVVDRVAVEAPDTLLLAEAFWMMEGYFVRTLGMHRVYNSAFMNMLKREDNANYRTTIKKVLEFNPQILKRFVNFMNNPDEETAVAQFGKDDKYFGICLMMGTLPGLPMFGHGQVEGFEERYGMEYRRAYRDEQADGWLVARHEREIFPLLQRRYLFSGVEQFLLYDFYAPEGWVDEDVFAYSNRSGDERALVLVHNKFKETRGWLKTSVGFLDGSGAMVQRTLAEGLALSGRGPRAWVRFRDHIRGLEYLRSADELREKGLYQELRAFEYRAFVDFREEVDTPERPWGRLAAELGGRGVPSLEGALTELVFRGIHASFYEAINAGSARYLFEAETERPDAAAQLRAEQRAALDEKLRHLKEGVAYVLGPFEAGAEMLPRLLQRYERVASLFPGPERRATRQLLLAWSFTAACRELLEATTKVSNEVPKQASLRAPEASASAGSSAGQRDVVREWHLDRVLQRVLAEVGGVAESVRRDVALVRLAEVTDGCPGLVARLQRLLVDPVARDFLGVNAWDGRLWFRQEPMVQLVTWLEQVERVEQGESVARAAGASAPEGRSALLGQEAPGTVVTGQEVLAAAEKSRFQLEAFEAWLEARATGRSGSRPAELDREPRS